jgi:hypothetical protein
VIYNLLGIRLLQVSVLVECFEQCEASTEASRKMVRATHPKILALLAREVDRRVSEALELDDRGTASEGV